jgi:hypothetical protein
MVVGVIEVKMVLEPSTYQGVARGGFQGVPPII